MMSSIDNGFGDRNDEIVFDVIIKTAAGIDWKIFSTILFVDPLQKAKKKIQIKK